MNHRAANKCSLQHSLELAGSSEHKHTLSKKDKYKMGKMRDDATVAYTHRLQEQGLVRRISPWLKQLSGWNKKIMAAKVKDS